MNMWGAGLAIRYNDIYFEREIAEGRYAKVYKANVYGTDVAVKVPKEDSARILELFKTEGMTLSCAISFLVPEPHLTVSVSAASSTKTFAAGSAIAAMYA